jgi:predicted GNAT family acetyltransferase
MRHRPQVVDNPEAQRFETRVGRELAGFAEYEIQGDTMLITHVVVQPRFERGGLGSALTEAALDAARDRDLRVIPLCSFARSFVRRNPRYADLVPDEERERAGVPH